MIRGTTPFLAFDLPLLTSLIKSAEIILKYTDQNKSFLIEKTLEDCEIGEQSLTVKLTQAETLQLPAPATAEVQLRVLLTDDTSLATDPFEVDVGKLLKDGEIV